MEAVMASICGKVEGGGGADGENCDGNAGACKEEFSSRLLEGAAWISGSTVGAGGAAAACVLADDPSDAAAAVGEDDDNSC